MTKPSAPQSDPQDGSPVLQGSYVLRLWRARSGELYGYVLDVRSGIRHPLHRVDELSSLIRCIIAKPAAANIVSEPKHDLK